MRFFLQEVLSELNFQLNSQKTKLTEEIVSNAIKQDKLTYISEEPLYRKSGNRYYSTRSSLQQEALFIHQFSRKHPNSGTLTKMLTIFASRLEKRKTIDDVRILISIITDIAVANPKTYKVVIAIISKLINKVTEAEKVEIVNSIFKKFKRFPNTGEIQIWMQRIAYNLPIQIAYDEALCKIVNNEIGVELWNNDWVDEAYKKDFPQNKICTDWIRKNYTPIIATDEVSLFNVNY